MRPFCLLALAALFTGCDSPKTTTPFDVQETVNREIEYRSDRPGRDDWQIPTRFGDCEDYVLLKRQRLIEGGFDPEDLQVILAEVPGIGGHAVLYIKSTDMVLDNNERGILSAAEWRKEYNPKFGCIAADISEGNIYPVSKRCDGPFRPF